VSDVSWPDVSYARWRETCDTLHAHSQLLGKIAVALAPKEPQLQHGALRLTARGWETRPLPAPNHSGAIVLVLDLHRHETRVEHSDGRVARVPLMPAGFVTGTTVVVSVAIESVARRNPSKRTSTRVGAW